MQHCRRVGHPPRSLLTTTTSHTPTSTIRLLSSSEDSPYSPSNFTQPISNKAQQTSPLSSSLLDNSEATATATAHALPSTRPHYAYPQARSRSPATEIPGTRLTPWTWVKTLFGWRPTPAFKPAAIQVNNNPYRARKTWPPDFRTLDPKQQFHFEKTYRRRAALKWARPTWNKSIKILQQTLITATLIYFIFICEPSDGQGTPFDGVSSSQHIHTYAQTHTHTHTHTYIPTYSIYHQSLINPCTGFFFFAFLGLGTPANLVPKIAACLVLR